MKDKTDYDKSLANKKSPFVRYTETVGWIQIMISPLLVGLIIGAFVYFSNPNKIRLIIGTTITATGLCIGIIWATKVERKKGTIHFMSKTMATPEFDNKDEEQN